MRDIFDLVYREYCRARIAEMRKQLFLVPQWTMKSGRDGDEPSLTLGSNAPAADPDRLEGRRD
jgi:hypothetical protein